MGEAELDYSKKQLLIHSHIVVYGGASDAALAEQVRAEIEDLWNEPQGEVELDALRLSVRFRITAEWRPGITELEVLQNVNPRYNFFRIEEFVVGNISFVDGLGCNTGYWKLENLYPGSTTAAHEYGHTLGLDHPRDLDLRGRGVPGIMYPRGTLVDPLFQYDPTRPAGVTGGTMHPMHRRVQPADIRHLRLQRLRFESGRAQVGEFTNIYHWDHAGAAPGEIAPPPLAG